MAIGAVSYLGVVVLVTWQALRGESIVAPGMLTLGALAALVAVTAGSVGLAIGLPVLNASEHRTSVRDANLPY